MDEAISDGELTDQAAGRFRAWELPSAPRDIRSIALTGVFVLALFYTMYFMRSILLPLVLAVLLSYLLRAMVRALGRVRIAASVAAALALFVLVAAIGFGFSFLAPPASAWLQKAPDSLQQLQRKLVPLRHSVERAAQANVEIEKMASSAAAQTKAIELKQHPLIDMLYVRTPQVVMNEVLLLILLCLIFFAIGISEGRRIP